MKNHVRNYLLLFTLLVGGHVKAQILTGEELAAYKNWPRYKDIVRLYNANNNLLLWTGKEDVQKEFLELLHLSTSLGLAETDYNEPALQNLEAAQTHHDTVDTDVRFTDAAFHFFTEVKNGNRIPAFGYRGLAYAPEKSEVLSLLKDRLVPGGLKKLLIELQPVSKEYAFAIAKLVSFQRVIGRENFDEAKIVSAKVDSTNKALVVRLYQLGFTDSVNFSITKKELLQKVMLAQQQFDLLNDGVLRSTALNALNVPLRQRIEELKIAVNIFRWLEELKQHGSVLLLNIPSANFYVYKDGKLVLDSRVIAGKLSTPTPTLTSTINEVVLYPYWMVPRKIAVNELLPSIKKNVAFLDAGGFQVVNKEGRVLNPSSINWRGLGKGNFPYIIRQSTGCDNALGLVKFNFYNPYTVYLHDTPGKILFSSARRFYSHGCMRIEKPEELAHLVLGSNRIAIDTLTAKGCIYHQSPIAVKTEKDLPVMVLYSTVWYTKEGELRFYDDVYNKLNFSTPIASTHDRDLNTQPGR